MGVYGVTFYSTRSVAATLSPRLHRLSLPICFFLPFRFSFPFFRLLCQAIFIFPFVCCCRFALSDLLANFSPSVLRLPPARNNNKDIETYESKVRVLDLEEGLYKECFGCNSLWLEQRLTVIVQLDQNYDCGGNDVRFGPFACISAPKVFHLLQIRRYVDQAKKTETTAPVEPPPFSRHHRTTQASLLSSSSPVRCFSASSVVRPPGFAAPQIPNVYIITWLLFFFIHIALLVVVVYQLICLADLEFDYINPYDSASRINFDIARIHNTRKDSLNKGSGI
ncbi:hypothetical protein LXL04_037679 [Taraxacum kok-saghyz]